MPKTAQATALTFRCDDTCSGGFSGPSSGGNEEHLRFGWKLTADKR